MSREDFTRRQFVKRCVIAGCGLAWAAYTLPAVRREGQSAGLRVGFSNDAPEQLDQWSKEAAWQEPAGRLVRCVLCPHECLLAENDRGFCRTRVVKQGRLHTVAYGNPCTVHIDPVEKKPLYHFLPGTPILSVATAGCNLRCLNCQNWQISQAKPEATENTDLPPQALVRATAERSIPSIAYTYSEPVIFYEYVRDSAVLAREQGIRNVLVTAGYISAKPCREISRVTDAANVDIKAFGDHAYRKLCGATLAPVLRALEVMREEGVWLEITRLVVPAYSDDPGDIRQMCRWMVSALGPDTPLHLSRFHPDHKLQGLPPTPVELLDRCRDIAREAGLRYVYVGNVPGHGGQDTICPSCHRTLIERAGLRLGANLLVDGRCPCGQAIAGVWT
jgi:pyruvate formate lyase activating enzyme